MKKKTCRDRLDKVLRQASKTNVENDAFYSYYRCMAVKSPGDVFTYSVCKDARV